MAAVEVSSNKRLLEPDVDIARKRFRASELPLSPSQRSTIDGILHTFKKKGEFDTLRKQVWNHYSESIDKTNFITSLEDLAEAEIDRDTSLLSRDRGKAATLMQGAVDRSDIYKSVESSLDRLLAEHLGHVEATVREIRRAEVGEDVAAEEQKRGSKTDEEYDAEAAVRRAAREEQRKKDEARKRREEEKERLRAEEAKKKAELDRLRRREERRKEEEAKEAKRKQDREHNRALLKKAEEEQARKRQERRERREREEYERLALQDPRHERVQSAHREVKSESVPPKEETPKKEIPMPETTTHDVPPAQTMDEKDLEAIALERLLDEGRELAAKSDSKHDLKRPGSLDPPSLRKSLSVKALGQPSPPKGPASDRIHSPLGLEPPKGPRLSFTHTRPVYSPRPAESQYRERSPQRSHLYHTSSHHDSPSDPYRTYDSEAKAAWKKQALARRDDEAEYYKSTPGRERSPTREREDEYRHRGYYEEDKYAKDRSREYYDERDERYQERDPDRYREHEKDYRSSRHDRSHSRDMEAYRESHSHRDRERESEYKIHSSRYEDSHHERRYTRSRSPTTRSSHRRSYEKPAYTDTRSARPSDRPRAKSPVEIDRYIPSTSSWGRERHTVDGAEERDPERDREKPVTREGYKERDEYRDKERQGTRDGYKERDEYREREDYREKDRERERHGDRDLREKKGFVEIDRYVPGGGSRVKEQEYPRARERDLERERTRERDREKEVR